MGIRWETDKKTGRVVEINFTADSAADELLLTALVKFAYFPRTYEHYIKIKHHQGEITYTAINDDVISG